MKNPIKLIPLEGVSLDNEGFIATSVEPWFLFSKDFIPQKSGFYEIEYSSDIYSDPIRPILQIQTKNEKFEYVLPGPVAGMGLCSIYFNRDIKEIKICPIASKGSFNFRICFIRRVSHFEIVKLIIERKPSKLFSIIIANIFGYHREALSAIDWVINGENIKKFDEWIEKKSSSSNDSFYYRNYNNKNYSKYLFILHAEHLDNISLNFTISSLRRLNRSANEVLLLIAENIYFINLSEECIPNEEKISLNKLKEFINLSDYVIYIKIGSVLYPYFLSVISELIIKDQKKDILYFDEIIEGNSVVTPSFKPNWSPILFSQSNYIGDNFVISAKSIIKDRSLELITQPDRLLKKSLENKKINEVAHIRRLLLKTPPHSRESEEISSINYLGSHINLRQSASIIIPTKDRVDLLQPCIESILSSSLIDQDEIIIIDHQSEKKSTKSYFAKLISIHRRIKIISYTGPFNYSDMNNHAVTQSTNKAYSEIK